MYVVCEPGQRPQEDVVRKNWGQQIITVYPAVNTTRADATRSAFVDMQGLASGGSVNLTQRLRRD